MQSTLIKFDNFQTEHRYLAFPVAVIKRYNKDNTGRMAILFTYYGFMALFPLLLSLSLLTNWLNGFDPTLAERLIHGATNYFPVVGHQLYQIAHSSHRPISSSLVFVLLALYGARGAANIFSIAINNIWNIPKNKRAKFPKSWLESLEILFVGGGGLTITTVATSWVLGYGHSNWFRLIVSLFGILLLSAVFVTILKISLPQEFHFRRLYQGALTMAVALTLVQFGGGYIITHELKDYQAYSALFATTLGLLAYIYIVTQIIFYSIEITVVAEKKEWPINLIER